MRLYTRLAYLSAAILLLAGSCKKDGPGQGILRLEEVRAGSIVLAPGTVTKGVPSDSTFSLRFNLKPDAPTIDGNIILEQNDSTTVPVVLTLSGNGTEVVLAPATPLKNAASYRLLVKSGLKGSAGESFSAVEYPFVTADEHFTFTHVTLNQADFNTTYIPRDVDCKSIRIEMTFSEPLDTQGCRSFFSLRPSVAVNFTISDSNRKITLTNAALLDYYTHYYFTVSKSLTSETGNTFAGFSNSFYTALDSTPKFPLITDDELLTLIQRNTFRYFYDFAHPACGMARERNTSGDVVTTGGSGFGVMALVAGMQRNFITRAEGLGRVEMILDFLETCDRFHGAWPHWLNGNTGKTVPFTQKDDGADLVETSYMVEGLYTLRQFLNPGVAEEKWLRDRIDALTDAVEYDWFTRGQDVLYWHWSPNYDWAMNMQITGYNETLITYILAATSTTHPVAANVYHRGYARNGAIVNGNTYYGYRLPLGQPYGGPLFFVHYSFLGLDPRNLSDIYANYWEQNVNQSLINMAYCADNPKRYIGYGSQSWGLTACDNPWGYNAHSPTNDLGVIAPTAAVSSLPYTPQQSMDAIRHFYYMLGDRLWGPYGFYDSFDATAGWWAESYLAIDQGPIVCMIENYRSGLLWNLFMSHPKVGPGLEKLGFAY